MTRLHPALVRALSELFGIPPADVRPDARLDDDLQLDSLATVELQVHLEEALGVRIDADDPDQVHTLADLQAVLDAAVERGQPLMPVLKLTEDR